MRVFVAGGAGYLGCILVQELLSRGHEVTIFDRLAFGRKPLEALGDRAAVEVGDIREIRATQLEGFDAAINLAGISSDPVAGYNPALTRAMNVDGAILLAEACKEAGVCRYLFASTCSVYESDDYRDEADVLLDETSPLAPTSPYAKSKLEAEGRLLDLAGPDFFPVLLRKGTLYGFSPRMRYDLVINTLLKDALSRGVMLLHAGGETWRPVVEIRDAARAYAACLEADPASVGGQAFSILYGNFRVCEMGLRLREALRDIGVPTDLRAEYTQPKSRSYRVSCRKTEALLGFRPATSIEESARHAVNRIRQSALTDFENPRYYNLRWFEERDRVSQRCSTAAVSAECRGGRPGVIHEKQACDGLANRGH